MILLLALACTPDETVTWHADVRPVVEANCASCHTQDGGIGGFGLTDLDQVMRVSGPVVDAVETRRMPPWGMDGDCREVPSSVALSEHDVALFTAWSEAGFPEGDPADYVPPATPEVVELSDPDLVLELDVPADVDPTFDDDYRCFAVGEPLADDLFITATRTLPTNLTVAHHALVFALPASDQAGLQALADEDPRPGWACFGDAGLGDAPATIDGWVPGTIAAPFGPGVAMRIPAGSQLVLQMHYNTLLIDEAATDSPTVELWTLPEGELPDQLLVSYPIANTGFRVEPGETGVQVTATQRVPADAQIVGTGPHMHLLGQSLETTLIRPDGSRECLSRVPVWDFDWQYSYETDVGIPISIDDEVEITCTYDNPTDQALTWGDGTNDEMCLDYLAMLVPYDGGGESGVCGGYDGCAQDCADGDAFCEMACMTAQGEGCLYCGLDALFGTCTTNACATEMSALWPCLSQCADTDEAWIGCLYDTCGAEFDAYHACVDDTLAAGQCARDYADCPELL